MALLAALSSLSKSPELHLNFSVLHIEHGLRPPEESRGDADFVLDFCGRGGIDCKIKRIPPGKIASLAGEKGTGIEAAARYFRHKAFRGEAKRRIEQSRGESLHDNSNDQARKKAVILLAHTNDDLLETTLMRVLRGAGPAGLRAMRPDNRDAGSHAVSRAASRGSEDIEIARPLLNMTRGDIENYLKAKNVSWREDSTNNDEKFLRNRIRRSLTPVLNESFPGWKKGVAALGETQSLVNGFILREAKKRIEYVLAKDNRGKFLIADEENFFAQPEIIREESIFYGIDILLSGKKSLSKPAKRSVIRKFCAGSVNAADLGLVRIWRKGGKIYISRARKDVFERGISCLLV